VQNVAGDNGFAESFSNLYSPTAFGGRGDAPFSTNLIAAFAANREIYATLLTGVDAKIRNSVLQLNILMGKQSR
jgi:hypothetical protein